MKYNIGDKVTLTNGNIMTIDQIDDISKWYRMKEDPWNCYADEMFEGLVEPIDCKKCGLTRNSIRCLFMDNCPHNKEKNIIEIPKDYVIKDENGNVINATKIVLEKKKEYPKTYEECCQYLGCNDRIPLRIIGEFTRLINARNAYWNIAGEEMGLGKPWEPDWNDEKQDKYGFHGEVKYTIINSAIFVFPTAEMRDAFYENFKELINECK